MTLTAKDCDNIRDACYHLAMCWDALRAVEKRHNNLMIHHARLSGLTADLGHPPDSSTLADEQIRKALQDLQEDGQAP